jgi:hypothetical protein
MKTKNTKNTKNSKYKVVIVNKWIKVKNRRDLLKAAKRLDDEYRERFKHLTK